MRQIATRNSIDPISLGLFLVLVLAGWLNIYAAEYDPSGIHSIWSLNSSSGRQLVFIFSSFLIIAVLTFLDHKFYDSFAYILYFLFILLLILVLVSGREVAGSRSWFGIGGFGIQPSEFAKFATAFALAKYLDNPNRRLSDIKTLILSVGIIMLPIALIIIQGDTGTSMVYFALIIPLFREGMPPYILIMGGAVAVLFILTLLVKTSVLYIVLGVLTVLMVGLFARNFKKIALVITSAIVIALFIRSVDFILYDVLKPHQQKRIQSLVNPNIDPLGIGWNVTQSKIAIGSGGLSGKGFLQGTQTKFDFVPAQTTDFIFCTIGEEHGWIGSMLMIAGFIALLLRLVYLSERQKSTFSRVYGYAVIAIIFFHFALNIAMTIGLFPVIGIPLPFFSYGGSSLWAFTILLFSFLKLDASRSEMLQRS